MKINSRDNQNLKTARKVRDGKIPDLIFVEGLRLAEECLRSKLEIESVFLNDVFLESARAQLLFDQFRLMRIKPFELTEHLLSSISDTNTSQGIVIIARRPEIEIPSFAKPLEAPNAQLFVLLHEINNPSNLGAIIRTAEAAKVSGILLTKNSADPYSPKSLRASMGSAFRVPISVDVDFDATLHLAAEFGFATVCADTGGLKPHSEFDWKRACLLAFGSEAHGLTSSEIDQISETIVIPMANTVESLNLAVSCGIILFEAQRQRAS